MARFWISCLKMVILAILTIFSHGRQGSPRVADGRQGFPRSKGDPRDGWDELEPNRSYLSHFTTWYSKSGHFPIENPIKNENWPLTPSYGSIILKIVLWAHFTNSHAVLRGSSDILKNPYFGTGYFTCLNVLHKALVGPIIIMGQCPEKYISSSNVYAKMARINRQSKNVKITAIELE